MSTNSCDIILSAVFLTNKLLDDYKICQSHSLGHFLKVLEHSRNAVYEYNPGKINITGCLRYQMTEFKIEKKYTDEQEIVILLASLLHDVDDPKLFPKTTIPYPNARAIMSKLPIGNIKDLVIECIDLTSARKNKNNTIEDVWKLIPRNSDRLEAIGKSGILRCLQYSKTSNMPLYTSDTPRVTNDTELKKIVTSERFANYSGVSSSMIDHYYDKLLHLKLCPCDNSYFDDKFEEGIAIMKEVVYLFGKNGKITESDVYTLLQTKEE